MREKLMELLEERRMQASEVLGSMNKGFGAWYADHLIANGVTLAEDNNVPSKWIPVTERLPKPYVDVITLRQDLISQNYHACGLEYITLRGEADIPAWSKDHLTWKNKVTHWMPLPQPPKGE